MVEVEAYRRDEGVNVGWWVDGTGCLGAVRDWGSVVISFERTTLPKGVAAVMVEYGQLVALRRRVG